MKKISDLVTEVNRFIQQSAKIWNSGFPNNPSKSQYKFEELSILTDGQLEFKCNMTGIIRAFLHNKEIGVVNISFDESNPIDAHINIIQQTTYFVPGLKPNTGTQVPTDTIIGLYYILIHLLKLDLEESKFKFERLGFDGFYERE
jgi:hypothetical protein